MLGLEYQDEPQWQQLLATSPKVFNYKKFQNLPVHQ